MLTQILAKGFPAWAEILIAIALDLLIGDPRWFPHPVRLIGWCISKGEAVLRRSIDHRPGGERARREKNTGIVLCAATVLITALIAWAIPFALGRSVGLFWASLARIVLLYFAIAARGLASAGRKVSRALADGDLPTARQELRALVGRDTDRLTKKGCVRAACESLAENSCDGVIAPLFWMGMGLLFSPRGSSLWILSAAFVWLYKAASTLDSMVGYRNAHYLHFGWASAKLDDALAYFPARLTAGLLIASAFILRLDGRSAFLTCARQHNQHASPNAGWPESAAAGALGIHMGGEAYYGGVRRESTLLGYDMHAPDLPDIAGMTRMLWLMLGMGGLLTAFWPYGMLLAAMAMVISTMIGRMGDTMGMRPGDLFKRGRR